MLSILSTPPFNILSHKSNTPVWGSEVRGFLKGKSLALDDNVIAMTEIMSSPVLRSNIYIA